MQIAKPMSRVPDLDGSGPDQFRDQRLLSDESFFNDLSLPGKAGAALKAALAEDREPEAKRIIAAHFRDRANPSWTYYLHGTAWLEQSDRGKVIDNADGLLNNQFHNAWYPHEIFDCRKKRGTGPDWTKAMQAGTDTSRNGFVVVLSTAYALTGNHEYINKAVALMRGFAKAVPFVLEKGFYEDQDRYFGGAGNGGLAIKSRILRWTDFLYSGAIQTPELVSDDDLAWIVKQIWFYCLQLHRLTGDRMRRDNHHLMDHGHSHFVAGVMYPEFSFSGRMRDYGKKVIKYHIRHNLFDDGCYAEHSTKYQYHIAWCLLGPYAIAKANGIELLQQQEISKLRKWITFLAHACKPSGVIADFGDEQGQSMEYLFENLASPVQTPTIIKIANALGYQVGAFAPVNAKEISTICQKRKNKPPQVGLSPHFHKKCSQSTGSEQECPQPAVQYPQGGFTFFRSRWDEKADFLGVSHYTESIPHGHAHWDMMSFTLHTQGETLIGEPAVALYQLVSKHPDYSDKAEYRGYFYAPDSHNCMIINDDTLKPLKALGHRCSWGGYPPRHQLGAFKTSKSIEILEMSNKGCRPFIHRRFVVHLRSLGFAFVDILRETPVSVRPHQYVQQYHLEWDVDCSLPSASLDNGGIRLTKGKAKALIIPGEEVDYQWHLRRDSFLSNLPGVRSKDASEGPTIVDLMRRNSGPVVFSTFIITAPAPRLRKIPKPQCLGSEKSEFLFAQQDRLSANVLDLGRHGRIWLASCPYQTQLDHPDLATDADLAVVLESPKGEFTAAAMVGGKTLNWKGKSLFKKHSES